MKATTTYLVWKDPNCNGIKPDWIQLSQKAFHALVKSPKGKGRFFERLASTEANGSDGRFVIETTERRFKEYLKEKRHVQYLRDSNPGYTVFSYHGVEFEDEDVYGEDILRDESCDVEAECLDKLERAEVMTAVATLSEEEQEMVKFFWLSDGQGTERDYSALTGIPQKTVNDRKRRILEKLRKSQK